MSAASDLWTTRTSRLADARLYLCTDARREHDDLADFVEAALAGGVDIIQLRDKGSRGEQQFGPLEITEALGALAILRAATKRHDALFAVNDRADLALAAEADILHLGQKDLPVAYARHILGPDVLIGRSTGNEHEARLADTDHETGYFCVGPVWATPTKPGRAASGLELVEATAQRDPVHPWFAIGGIDLDNVGEVVEAGATRIVVVRAITEAADPEEAARELTEALPDLSL